MGWKIARWFCLKIVYPLDPIVDHHFPNIHIAIVWGVPHFWIKPNIILLVYLLRYSHQISP